MIGQGGMGTVYKGVHESLARPVAIKMLHQHLCMDTQLKARFRNEAQLMASLQHPNLVQLYDYREIDNNLILIMEYVEGSPLDEMIGKKVGPIPSERTIPLFSQMLKGVQAAHSKGIVHRDIKPSNILITSDERVKVTDFGIAKIAGSKGMTQTGAKLGTLFYMSPEQIKGEEVDIRTDVYSLGVTLYEMLSGNMPFDAASTDYLIMESILKDSLPDPRKFYPHIPEWLVGVLYNAVEKDRNRRIPNCEEFQKQIESMQISKSIPKQSISVNYLQTEFCTYCGYKYERDFEFCSSCGRKREKHK